MERRALAIVLVALAGCDSAKPTPQATPESSAVASAAPKPSSSAPATAPPPSSLPLHVVLRIPASLCFAHAVQVVAVPSAEGSPKVFAVAGEGEIATEVEGRLQRVPDLSKGLLHPAPSPLAQSIVGFGGRYPDALYASSVAGVCGRGSPSSGVVSRRWDPAAKAWKDGKKTATQGLLYEQFVPYRDGVLAVVGPQGLMAQPQDREHLQMVEGKAAAPAIDPALRPKALAALPSGDVFVAGIATTGKVLVQHVTGEGKAEPSQVAGEGVESVVLQALAPNDVYVTVGDGLAHYDGKAWKNLGTPPARGDIASFSALPSGVVWVAVSPPDDRRSDAGTDHGPLVWRRDTSGAWTSLAIPALDKDPEAAKEYVPKQVFAQADGDLWVAMEDGFKAVLLRSKDMGAPLLPRDIEELDVADFPCVSSKDSVFTVLRELPLEPVPDYKDLAPKMNDLWNRVPIRGSTFLTEYTWHRKRLFGVLETEIYKDETPGARSRAPEVARALGLKVGQRLCRFNPPKSRNVDFDGTATDAQTP